MSGLPLLSRRSYGALMSRLVWLTATLLIATLGFVITTVLWTSDSANENAGSRQRDQLIAAIEQKLDELKGRLADFAEGPGLVKALAGEVAEGVASRPRIGRLSDYTAVYLARNDLSLVPVRSADPAERLSTENTDLLLQGLVEAARAHLDNARQANVVRQRRDMTVSRLQSDGSSVIAAVAVPIGALESADAAPEEGPVAAVAYKRLDAASLGKLAELHGIDEFQLSDKEPSGGRIALPILGSEGRVQAYLSWRPDRPGDLIRARLVPLTLFGSLVAIALFTFVVGYIRWLARDLAKSHEHAQDLLGRDPLSGLPNRLLFADRLQAELGRLGRTEGGLAVMFLDLDRFKDVNDTFGHQAGDVLIRLVGQRLQQLLRSSDTLARFGGDEFAIIQTDMKTPERAQMLALRILEALTAPFEINGTAITVGASIGISLAPENGVNREDLMRLADTALYQAKSEGRNRYRFFASQMDETIRMRKIVEDDLRIAIEQDELRLHYQPIYSANGETIVGLEALVRWPHPKQGLISPARFIAVAEERGLVVPLGEWVLRRACRDGRRWPGLTVAVNVSPIQFRHRDFVASITRILDDTGFEASRLEIELTEGVVVEDADAAEAAMMDLRALGVTLALDDFGTGYSSLIYLRRFAFDKIKIDRSFLESMEATGESAILVHSIVHLGRALGLTVTAEGVETKEQQRFLQALGCHQLQGFLLSKPVPPEEIDRLLGLGTAAVQGAEAA
jgi:diguanylate cyclase (GGDEF)-like protein